LNPSCPRSIDRPLPSTSSPHSAPRSGQNCTAKLEPLWRWWKSQMTPHQWESQTTVQGYSDTQRQNSQPAISLQEC
jgi:hypothetical protein